MPNTVKYDRKIWRKSNICPLNVFKIAFYNLHLYMYIHITCILIVKHNRPCANLDVSFTKMATAKKIRNREK